MKITPLAFVLILAALSPASAEVTGRAEALGSDTLFIDSDAFQLFGIDGVEFNQSCLVNGRLWSCGASATRALQTLLDPVVVTCTPTGDNAAGATPAKCTSDDGDLAEMMVRQGWALADTSQSDAYVEAEAAAKAAGDGIWRSTFVEPSVYRADMAAIEQRYSALAYEDIATETEKALTRDGGIEVFDEYRVVEVPAGSATTDAFVKVSGLGPDFIARTIGAQGVFTWHTVSQSLGSWQEDTASLVKSGALNKVVAELQNRPSKEVNTTNGEDYYAAMMENAKPWIEQGRQPVLLVTAPAVPGWIFWWFQEEPPVGANVTTNPRIHSPNYLGTVDGVDVYIGYTPDTASLLFPDDLLVEVAYRSEDGHILTLDVDRGGEPGDLVVHYSARTEWLDDPVVWLRYPGEEAEAVEGS